MPRLSSEKAYSDDENGETATEQHSNDNFNASSNSILTASQQMEKRRWESAWSSFIAMLLVLSWLVLSSAIIIFNKYVIDTAGFRFPITLTCWHQVFATIMTQILARTTSVLDSRKKVKMTGRTYLRAILPIGMLYSGSLVSSNLPYLTLSVAFIQMLKGLGPAAMLLATCSLGLDCAGFWTCFNIGIIVLGTAVASFGEIRFVLSGFLYQIGGLFFEAYRLAFIQRLLSSDEHKMDPLVSLYYYAPASAAMIAIAAMIGEASFLSWSNVMEAGIWTLVANAVVAFMLNVSSVMLIGKTSSLVVTLCGVLKNILIVITSVLIWDTIIAPLQIFGYGLSSIGLLYYSLGAETIHGVLQMGLGKPRARAENSANKRRLVKRHTAVLLIVVAAACGAIGGAVAGYSVEWDPRVYWYSATRLTGSKQDAE